MMIDNYPILSILAEHGYRALLKDIAYYLDSDATELVEVEHSKEQAAPYRTLAATLLVAGEAFDRELEAYRKKAELISEYNALKCEHCLQRHDPEDLCAYCTDLKK